MELQQLLETLAAPAGKYAKPAVLRSCILQLCQGRFLGLRVLAHVLQRSPDDLRKRTLKPLVAQGALLTAYQSLSDPRQAYSAASENISDKGQSA